MRSLEEVQNAVNSLWKQAEITYRLSGKTCEKGFEPEWKGEVDGRSDDDEHELAWVKWGECKGDWLV